MAAINITKKAVDILVNGTQQASYTQRANAANYDVSISTNNINWGSKGTQSTTYQGADYQTKFPLTDISTLDIDQNISLNGATINWRLYSTVEVLRSGIDYDFRLYNGGSVPYSNSITNSSTSQTATLVDKTGTGLANLSAVVGDWSFWFDVSSGGSTDTLTHTWEIYVGMNPSFSTSGVTQS